MTTPATSHPPSRPSRPRLSGLALNLLLSAVVSVLLLALLEGGGRLLEGEGPKRPVAEYLWNWEARWGGDFYTIGTDSTGWPPGREVNADGLRDRFRSREKPERTWRIVCLGDSVTMGAGIAQHQAYPQVLERQLWLQGRRIEAMNVALWGWSTRQERIAYERIARGYHPDQAILGICLNDVAEIQNNLAQPAAWLAWLHERSAFVRLVVGAHRREIRDVEDLFTDSPRAREALRRFFDEIRALRDATRADGVPLHVVIFPFRFQTRDDAPPPVVQERIADFCRAEGIPVLDALPVLAPLGDEGFVDYDHLSPKGARAVAGAIEASGWLPDGYADQPVMERFLGRSLPPGPRVNELRRALAASDAEVRQAACGTLLWRDDLSVNTAVLADLARLARGDPSSGVRAAACRALGAWGDALPEAGDALAGALLDPSEHVRAEAARALADLGPASRDDVPRLAGLLDHDDAYVASFAAWRLGALREGAAGAVPALTRALEREDRARIAAARALAQLGAIAGSEAVPALVATLDARGTKERLNAVRALGRVGPAAAAAVPPLTARLADANAPVRAETARALGRIGLAARPAVPALVERLREDEDPQVRAMAARALGWIVGARGAREALEAATSDPHRKVAREARKALERLGSR